MRRVLLRRAFVALLLTVALYLVGVAGGWEFSGSPAKATTLEVVR